MKEERTSCAFAILGRPSAIEERLLLPIYILDGDIRLVQPLLSRGHSLLRRQRKKRFADGPRFDLCGGGRPRARRRHSREKRENGELNRPAPAS